MTPTPLLKSACLASLAIAFSAGAASACAQYEPVVLAVQSSDTATAAALYEEIIVSAECDDALREWVGDYLARETFVTAMQLPADQRRETLHRALGYERHWRTFKELGVLSWQEQSYEEAAEQFQLALNELTEGDQDHVAAPDEIAGLYDYAWQSLALAEGPVVIPVTRSGTPGGIFTGKVRGFEVVEVPVPITFQFDSTEFDAPGKKLAETLVTYILSVGPDEISLVGHTDPTGAEDYNDTLSLARANAVGALLKERGFSGKITTTGLGESEVPAPPPGIDEGSEDHHRIARRVAFSAR